MYITRLDPGTQASTRYPDREDKRRRRPRDVHKRPRNDEVELSGQAPEAPPELVYRPGR